MDLLNYYYNLDIQKIKTYDRKVALQPNTIVKGAPLSGKTYLVWDYLKQQTKNYLYIDDNDIRDITTDKLQVFIDSHDIMILAIDNYHKSFRLPNVDNIIIISNSYKNSSFTTIKLNGLDYEEFISFELPSSNANYFNHFIKQGTLPINHKNIFLSSQVQDIYKKRLDNVEFEVFAEFVAHTSSSVTNIEIFNKLKQRVKISKDKFYKSVAKLIDSGYIYQLQKHNAPNASKKIYSYDFSLFEHFKEINFANTLENMVYLELLHLNTTIFYTLELPFFIESQSLVIAPLAFINEDSFIELSDKIYNKCKKLNVKSVKFITVGYEDRLSIEEIKYESIPFWLWATSQ